MKNFIIYVTILLCLFASKAIAQESFEHRAKAIADKIEKITKEEKDALKLEIESINNQLESGSISKETAEERKQKLAEARAIIIENKVVEAQKELRDLVQDKVDGKVQSSSTSKFSIDFNKSNEDEKQEFKDKKTISPEKRTTSQFVVALGANNLITDGKISDSDFGYLRSTFYEFGITGRTNVFKNSRIVNFKYGVSFMYNNLKATDNRYFVDNGNETVLEEYPINLDDKRSYFKNVYVTIPLHLEFDFSKEKMNGDKSYYASHTGFRFGIGGFVGYNTNSKQFLDFKEDGYRTTIRQKGDWNVNDWNYGLSAYVGYRTTSLYIKYDLNPLFKNNPVDQNNISLGLRFDMN